ncbi:putative quinol monooxygenase [Levilactobacillus andaensis]|uniref:putative quinol monooxygenase n=1 Tax=Levilactobacillus andaensis TaxID=2799570 RepID=UPI0019445889|nr:antibiotic biosynthesis monooxygenase family protein [Levilactobacillus andaensis]
MDSKQSGPLFRLFKLKIAADQRADFLAAGRQNLLTSIVDEPGTLAMYATHADEAGTENRVVEVYRDAPSYDVHAHSPQFAAFRTVAKQAVVQQEVVSLTPVLLLEQPQPLQVSTNVNQVVRLLEVTVKSGQAAAYRQVLLRTMQDVLATEPGTLTLKIGYVTSAPQKWVIFAVFQDVAAEQKHSQSAAFKQYQADSQPLVSQVTSTRLFSDTLVQQGGLVFKG